MREAEAVGGFVETHTKFTNLCELQIFIHFPFKHL